MEKKSENKKRKNKQTKKKKRKLKNKQNTRITKASYLAVRTCEPCSTFKHVIRVPYTQVSPDNSLHTNTHAYL